jgi:hypothetical protein
VQVKRRVVILEEPEGEGSHKRQKFVDLKDEATEGKGE